MKKYYVYIYVDHNSGNPVYIGKGSGTRDMRHISIAKKGDIKGHLYNWIRKYYVINNKWPTPFRVAEGMDEQLALDLERGLISLWGRKNLKAGSLVNQGEGGLRNAGFKRGKLSPESIVKRTASVLGRKNTPETIAKMRKSAQGRKMSPAAIVKIVAAIKARGPVSAETREKLSIANKGKPSWNKGRITPEDVKKKMALSHKGQTSWNKGGTMSAESKLKNSIAHMGKKKSEETKKRMSYAAKVREEKKRERLKLVA